MADCVEGIMGKVIGARWLLEAGRRVEKAVLGGHLPRQGGFSGAKGLDSFGGGGTLGGLVLLAELIPVWQRGHMLFWVCFFVILVVIPGFFCFLCVTAVLGVIRGFSLAVGGFCCFTVGCILVVSC